MFVYPTHHQLPPFFLTTKRRNKTKGYLGGKDGICHPELIHTFKGCLFHPYHIPGDSHPKAVQSEVTRSLGQGQGQVKHQHDESRTRLWKRKTIITLGNPVNLADRGCFLCPCSLIAQFRVLALESNLVSLYLNTFVSSTVKADQCISSLMG